MDLLKKQRKYLRMQVTKLIGKENLMTKTEEKVKFLVLLEQLREKKKELKDIEKEILILSSDTEDDIEKELDISEEYEEKLIEAIKKIEINLKEGEEKKEKSNEALENIEMMKPERKDFSVRLPKIELPTFQGDLNSWFTFWQIFEANIHNREDLCPIDKLSYLLSLLSGEPARLVSSFSATAENYNDIVKILKQHYGKKDRIIDANVKKILEMKPVYSANKIKDLKFIVTEITIILRNLKNMGINTEQNSAVLNTKIKQLIPVDLLLLYERQKKKEEESTDNLINFLQTEINLRENVSPVLDPEAAIFTPRRNYSSQRNIANKPTNSFVTRIQIPQNKIETPSFVANEPWVARTQQPNRMARSSNYPNTTTRSARDVICYKCSQLGHIARNCPSK